jgi:hypothetical protein
VSTPKLFGSVKPTLSQLLRTGVWHPASLAAFSHLLQRYPIKQKLHQQASTLPTMAAQLPVPIVNGMTAEGNNIAQNIQAYNAHQ